MPSILKTLFSKKSNRSIEDSLRQGPILPASPPPTPEWDTLFKEARDRATKEAATDVIKDKLRRELFIWKYGQEAIDQGHELIKCLEENPEVRETLSARSCTSSWEDRNKHIKAIGERWPNAVWASSDRYSQEPRVQMELRLEQVLPTLAEYIYETMKPSQEP